MTDELAAHLGLVARGMLRGDVVPVLGAGANLCDRPAKGRWQHGDDSLPNGAELAEWLADELECTVTDPRDLLRVCQYVLEMLGDGPLYRQLRSLLHDREYPVPSLHRFLAGLPGRMEARGLPRQHQMIVTTNYDDLMELALVAAGEPFDVVRYIAKGKSRGKFVHEHYPAPAGAGDGQGPLGNRSARTDGPLPEPRFRKIIGTPKKYDTASPKQRTVVLKIHGGIDRRDAASDSYVITEDDYIDYLTHTSPSDLIAAPLLDKLVNSHFLFLGYAMRDWNLRVILHRVWALRELSWESWAVQLGVEPLDEKMWDRQRVELREMLLSAYTSQLSDAVDAAIRAVLDRREKELVGAIG